MVDKGKIHANRVICREVGCGWVLLACSLWWGFCPLVLVGWQGEAKANWLA